MARVELMSVSKAWEKAIAVDGLDLAIDDGEFVAILGPSGCGKSTTLFMLAGIYTPTEGEIRFDGARVNEVEARDRNVGIVFQSYALYPNMTVLQNIMFPLRFQSMAKAEAQKRARAAATLVQVDALKDRRPSQLSGGQQQRVALARALVKEPRLLLLDEPLSNLDATLRLTMRSEIRNLQRQLGVTTVLVTHDQIEATTMADRIIVMHAGRLEQVGSPDDLYARPETRFVAGFIGSPPMNILDVTAEGAVARSGETLLPLSGTNGRMAAAVGIRPEHISFADVGLPAEAVGVEPLGRESLLLVETPAGAMRVLEAGPASVRPGERVHLAWDATASMAFDAAGRRIPGARVSIPAIPASGDVTPV